MRATQPRSPYRPGPFDDRFRPDQIGDPLMRARLYRDIRRQTPRVDRDSWTSHTIAPSEVLMPELVSYRVYRSKRFKWVVLAAAGLDDYRRSLESGVELQLPTVEWLRDRLRHYAKLADVVVTPPAVKAPAPLAAASPSLDLPDDPSADEALQDALAALAEPTPLVKDSDQVNDESLNRQRDAVDVKLDAVRRALEKLERRR